MELYNLEEWARARQTETVLAFRRAQLSGLTTGVPARSAAAWHASHREIHRIQRRVTGDTTRAS